MTEMLRNIGIMAIYRLSVPFITFLLVITCSAMHFRQMKSFAEVLEWATDTQTVATRQ